MLSPSHPSVCVLRTNTSSQRAVRSTSCGPTFCWGTVLLVEHARRVSAESDSSVNQGRMNIIVKSCGPFSKAALDSLLFVQARAEGALRGRTWGTCRRSAQRRSCKPLKDQKVIFTSQSLPLATYRPRPVQLAQDGRDASIKSVHSFVQSPRKKQKNQKNQKTKKPCFGCAPSARRSTLSARRSTLPT